MNLLSGTQASANQTPAWRVPVLLAAMMVVVPAAGVPNEEPLQDTLKSILVAFFALASAFAFFWQLRQEKHSLTLHALMTLPLALMTYALGSMLWSHPYLGGAEAVRWFVLGLILFLGSNSLTLERVGYLAWGIHLGAVLASLWTALQFWSNFGFFAQGPNPASTFVNRNFFAEYVVCTLPFSVLLLSRIKDKTSVFLLTFSLAFNVVALMMTGTRSALIGLVLLALLLPGLVYKYHRQFVSSGWRSLHLVAIVMLLLGSITMLGSIPTGNPKIVAESGRSNALDRAFNRTASIAKASEYSTGSFSIRATMWKATGRMILAHPLTGVGAGAWEVQAPLYQEAGSQLETDYYAHNELLQLIAEYGLLGWLLLIGLFSYLLWAAYKTWSDSSVQAHQEAPLRALILTSLLMFLLVSNAGFPWRLASTGALFALCLAILAASDLRLGLGRGRLWSVTSLTKRESSLALGATVLAAILAMLIAQQALECENKLVRAVKIALTIQQSGAPNDPGWTRAKGEMLQLLEEGVAINPNYRKLTPITADAMAGWGDWKNATWVWESVLSSRPYVVALLINVARGHMQMGHFDQAAQYMDRARKIQPDTASLKSLEVALWSRSGQEQRAARRAKELFDSGFVDRELVQVAYFLGIGQHQPALAIQALEVGIRNWPTLAVDSWLKLGAIYNSAEARDPAKALQAYSAALAASTPQNRESVLDLIPAPYRAQLQ